MPVPQRINNDIFTGILCETNTTLCTGFVQFNLDRFKQSVQLL